ncbi:MAG: phytanoyl-CoA dioxygenase family protein [Fibrobacterota bacterium]|nr:phytanoyl-CoA dioxygenase family protein [Fibrobacterota bacterium]
MKKTILNALAAIRLLGPLRVVQETLWLIRGWRAFKKTGVTPKRGHQGLVACFCRTSGRSNDYLHNHIAKSRPPVPIDGVGVLGSMAPEDIARIKTSLDDRGYHVFAHRLPDALCDRMLQWALAEKAVVKVDKQPILVAYDRANPIGVRYEWTEEVIMKCPEAQVLMADPGILAVAQAYLGCKPILDLIASWWHTDFSRQPDKDAAQFFHFDMDRVKWLKFFFYITDVGPDNGPHTFVAGSHRTGGINRSILDKGQVRIEDAEVLGKYAPEDIIEFIAPRGTIIAEDTRGLHKGKHVHSGDRLVFQLEFSDSLFGMEYPDPRRAPAGDALRAMAKSYPGVYDRYL